MKRKEVTEVLKKAAIGYFVKKKYAVHTEIGVERWGKRRVDLLALNLRGEIIIAEIKSCPDDYKSDKKWRTYLDKANKFYFVVSDKLFNSKCGKIIQQEAKKEGAGILALCQESGFLKAKVKAKRYDLDTDVVLKLALKMAWRNGYNARNSRRRRQYL